MNIGTEPTLDRERIERLMAEILKPIKDNYIRGPTHPERVLEALNALAAAACLLIHGAEGPGGEAERFFLQAFMQHLNDPP
jgi:hypothetical protein